jgi:cell wall-associated NlpC family hydrolase
MQSSLLWLTLATIIWVLNVNQESTVAPVVTELTETQKVQTAQATNAKVVTQAVEAETTATQRIKVPPPSAHVESLIKIARGHLGKPYVYGKIGPDSFDCSGFVYGTHRELGIHLPRTSLNQSQIKAPKISREELQRGDLVFFDTSGGGVVNHSGIYLGNGEFIHASSGKAYSVTISSLEAWYKDKFRWGKRLNATK